MTPLLLCTLFSLGLIGGFFSGLLGIGGGIIMVPLLLYIPSMLGLETITMKMAAGITMVQSLAGAFSGLIVHRKNNFVHRQLVTYMGTASIIGSLTGSIFSTLINGQIMLGIFAGMALVSSVMMFLPHKKDDNMTVQDVSFNRYLAFFVAILIGFLGGIVGQGGAFILIPLMLYIVKIPTRIALGSSTAIAFLSALAGFIGKWGTGQIPFIMALVLVAGALIGGQAGGRLSKRLPTVWLRTILSILISFTALKMWFDLNPAVAYFLAIALAILVLSLFKSKKELKASNKILTADSMALKPK